jgi:hypothetical protein
MGGVVVMSSLVIDQNQGSNVLGSHGTGNKIMGRYQAFAIHLMVSCVVVLIFLTVMKQFWYPEYFFEVSAGWSVLKILIMVDLVLGPAITLIIFKAGKPGLKFDLAVIAALQIAALLYGGSIIFQNRPGYLVFAVDRFEVVAVTAVDETAIPGPELRRAVGNPIPIIYASLPDDEEARNKILFEVVSGGADIEMRPELYKPFQENLDKVFMKSIDISMLISGDVEAGKRISKFVSGQSARLNDFLYYPLVGKNRDMLIVFARTGGRPVGVVDVNPWLS